MKDDNTQLRAQQQQHHEAQLRNDRQLAQDPKGQQVKPAPVEQKPLELARLKQEREQAQMQVRQQRDKRRVQQIQQAQQRARPQQRSR
jgi:hypothetical protein